MYKSIEAYIDEIDKREKAVCASRERIKALTEEYKKEVELYSENIRRRNYENDAILKMSVQAELETIIECLAKKWGTQKENLQVSFITGYNFSAPNKEFANHNIKHFNDEKNESSTIIAIRFLVEYKNGEDYKFVSFDTSIALNALQKDGKTFGEHIFAEGEEQVNGVVDVVLVLDEHKNIVLPFIFKTLIERSDNGKYVPRDEMSKVIIEAAEDMRIKQNDSLSKVNIEAENI